MPSDFITAVHVEPRGTFDHVHVSVRGQVVGVLITDKGDGERVKNTLLGGKYFAFDRPVDGPITREELVEWRALASSWLEVEEIVTIGATGFVGRIVLRLLDALHEARARLVELDGLLVEAQEVLGMSGHAIKAMKRVVQATAAAERGELVPYSVPEASSLVKDFHVLYRVTERLVADLDAEKVTDLGEVKAQLRRLMPAFEECEVARRMAWHTKEGN